MDRAQNITTTTLPGVALPISRIIMGCDNKDTYDEGAAVWDHWVDVGGNAFDTAFVYGGGQHEAALGDWIKRRNMASRITVIVKGAHTPECTPEGIGKQLTQSLDRLNLERAPIYIMHRDNPDVPVEEFVSALNALHDKGLIGIFGGSNWSTTRIDLARQHAANNSLKPFSILNNNLSLAAMEKPVWPGCISSRDDATLRYLKAENMAHISWSSQVRGYFLPEALRNRLPEDTRPEACFGCPANTARRVRAEALAKQRGVTANNIALAWVLAQPFPSFALVGPRTKEEISSTLPACSVELTEEEVRWLDEG